MLGMFLLTSMGALVAGNGWKLASNIVTGLKGLLLTFWAIFHVCVMCGAGPASWAWLVSPGFCHWLFGMFALVDFTSVAVSVGLITVLDGQSIDSEDIEKVLKQIDDSSSIEEVQVEETKD